jgi:hypothetical protein
MLSGCEEIFSPGVIISVLCYGKLPNKKDEEAKTNKVESDPCIKETWI